MDIDDISLEYLKNSKNAYCEAILLGFVKHYGIQNITPELLNKFEEHFKDQRLFGNEEFWKFYKKAMDNENAQRNKRTNEIMMAWTWVAGVAAVVSAIGTIITICG